MLLSSKDEADPQHEERPVDVQLQSALPPDATFSRDDDDVVSKSTRRRPQVFDKFGFGQKKLSLFVSDRVRFVPTQSFFALQTIQASASFIFSVDKKCSTFLIPTTASVLPKKISWYYREGMTPHPSNCWFW